MSSLRLVSQVAGLLGIVGSMVGMGLGLTVAQIVTPLKNVRLVVLVLLANFVLVPLFAYVISLIIPLEDSLKIGLIVVALFRGRALPGVRGPRRQGQHGRRRRR